jgi:hypothetical protein
MDFYIHFLCRAYRHSNIVECAATRRAAALAVVTMMEDDDSIEPTTAWWDALWAADEAASRIAARRQRRGAMFASVSARWDRIDSKGRIAAHFDRKPRSRRATFA